MVIVSVWQVHSAAIFSSRSQSQFYKDWMQRIVLQFFSALPYHILTSVDLFIKLFFFDKIITTVLIRTKINHLIHWIVHLVSCSEHCLNIVWMFRIRFQFPFQPPDGILHGVCPA